MKQLKVKSAHLAAGLAKVLKAKTGNSVITAIENVHAKTVKGGLVLTFTNLDTTITTGIEAEAEPGTEFLIPPQAYQVLQMLKDEDTDIEISIDNSLLTFSYDGNILKFSPEPVDKFPKSPTLKNSTDIDIEDSGELFTIFDNCLSIASKDDLRPALTGVYFTHNQIAATDAHRLIKAKWKCPVKQKFEVIIPKGLITALPILDSKVKIRIDKTYVSVNDGATQIISRSVDAKFPDFNAVIPKDSHIHITVNAAEVKRNIRIATIVDPKVKKVTFAFSKTGYTATGQDVDFGQEIILNGKCQVALVENFEKLTIAFNGQFLSQMIDITGATDPVLEFSGSNKAMVMQEGDYTLLTMPLMLNEAPVTKSEQAEPTKAEIISAKRRAQEQDETEQQQPEPQTDELDEELTEEQKERATAIAKQIAEAFAAEDETETTKPKKRRVKAAA